MTKKESILQHDSKQLVAALGTERWLTFPASNYSEEGSTTLYCALMPLEKIEAARERISWELSIGHGMPGCTIYSDGDEERTAYLRFGNDNGIEPLLIRRDFHGLKPAYTEISEEFRLFHDLYFDSKNHKYIKFDDQGGEEDSIVFEGETIKIRVKHIRQFLAIKEMFLAVYFDITRWAKEPLEVLGLTDGEEQVRQNDLIYDLAIRSMLGISDRPSLSRLLGKKIILGYNKEKSGIWPYNEEKEEKYEHFIIDVDEDDEPILYDCNPDNLANYFGANPDAPHYLTPVFFRRDVLGKYYADPAKYQIDDNILHCASLWSVRMDNNHSKYIIVYLGDLGRDLSHEEQLYWKSFNVIPDGTISDAEFKRAFLAQFAEPEQADLRFKLAYERFHKKWVKQNGWPLFRPLNEEDRHVLSSIRVPLTDDFSEFDTQLLYLTKLLVDSLNDAEIQKRVTGLEAGARSIAKFEAFLNQSGATGYEPHIKFLRGLYQLRSIGAGHRKGSDYNKKAAAFGIADKELSQVLSDFLDAATAMLLFLEQSLLVEHATMQELSKAQANDIPNVNSEPQHT